MPQIGEIRKGSEIGYKDANKRIWAVCENCGRERWVRLIREKPCSRICQSCSAREVQNRPEEKAKRKSYVGEKTSNWKGGCRKTSRGYIRTRVYPGDFFYPMARKEGYVLEHRLVVAKAIGRNLHLWEIVHHKHNKYPAGSIEDKQDNRYPENLQLVSDDRHRQITLLERKIASLQGKNKELEIENGTLKRKGQTYQEFLRENKKKR